MILTLARRGTLNASIRSHAPGRETLALALLVAAVLLMPVAYRAGTDQVHLHAIIQPMLDEVIGNHHHHADDPAVAPPSPFSSPAIPLVTPGSPTVNDHLASEEPDLPHQLEMAGAGLATAAVLGLGLLIAALLATPSRRPLWDSPLHLLSVAVGLEPPPPRQFPT